MTENTPASKADLMAMEERLLSALGKVEERFSSRVESTATRVREYIDGRKHDAETRLLRAFGDYQHVQTIRFARLKSDVGNIDASTDQRLTAIEDRLTVMDKRLIDKGI